MSLISLSGVTRKTFKSPRHVWTSQPWEITIYAKFNSRYLKMLSCVLINCPLMGIKSENSETVLKSARFPRNWEVPFQCTVSQLQLQDNRGGRSWVNKFVSFHFDFLFCFCRSSNHPLFKPIFFVMIFSDFAVWYMLHVHHTNLKWWKSSICCSRPQQEKENSGEIILLKNPPTFNSVKKEQKKQPQNSSNLQDLSFRWGWMIWPQSLICSIISKPAVMMYYNIFSFL